MKKVLFITVIPSPYRVQFFDELGKDCELTVLYTDKSSDHSERDKDWYIAGKKQFQSVFLKKRVELFGVTSVCLDVIDWLKKPFDQVVIHGYSQPTLILAELWMRLHGKPFTMEIDGAILAEESFIKYQFKRLLLCTASGWFSPGKVSDAFYRHYGVKQEAIRFYPFSSLLDADLLEAPTGKAEKEALRRGQGIAEKHVLVAVGSFIPRKGFDVLLRGASRLKPDTGIYFVGGEPTEEYLELAKHTGDVHVHFVGFCRKPELETYYKAADVFVLPTREDIWGLVINEAMGYGLPVVTTDRCVAGLELVEDGVNGYVVPVEDAEALADKINAVLDADLSAMGRASLEKIRPYTIEGMARAHRDVLLCGEVEQ